MKMNTTRVILLVMIVIAIFFMIPFSYVLTMEYLVPDEKEDARLDVEEVYFVDKGKIGDKTNLHVFVFVTNQGDKDCNSHIRAFAVDEETNIAMDDTSTTETEVEGDVTSEFLLQFLVPTNGSYRVEILVFKDEKITVKGQGDVDLRLSGTEGSDYRTTDTSEDEGDDNESAIPFVGPIGLATAVLLSIFVFRRWRR
mgnify:CR=1 FL=1